MFNPSIPLTSHLAATRYTAELSNLMYDLVIFQLKRSLLNIFLLLTQCISKCV